MRKGKAWVQLTKSEADVRAKDLRAKGFTVRRFKIAPGNYMLYYGKK